MVRTVCKILGELRCRIADFPGADAKEVLCCVLAAPSDILGDPVSKKALLDAAAQAGLRVLQIVDEGDSVASFAAQDDVACDSVVVLDVGGTRAKATSYTRHAAGILERAKCQDDASLSGDAFTSCLYDFAATFLRRRQRTG